MKCNFSNAELLEIVLIYGEAFQNSSAAARLYAKKYPNRHLPDPQTFIRVVMRGRENGNLKPLHGRGGGGACSLHYCDEEEILNIAEKNPGLSGRKIAKQTGVSQATVCRLLQKSQTNNFMYLIQHNHALQHSDYPLRVKFCKWLLEHYFKESGFAANVLATDHVIFTQNNVHNINKTHFWEVETSETEKWDESEQPFSLNVWAGIVNDRLIGPFYLPGHIDNFKYVQFLRHNLPELLENIPVDVRKEMYFIDNYSSDFSPAFPKNCNNEDGMHWINQSNSVTWPPRSSDLNPLYFFLWNYFKDEVYRTEVQTIDDLRERITAATEKLRSQEEDTLKLIQKNWIRRVQLCMQVDGQSFEYLL